MPWWGFEFDFLNKLYILFLTLYSNYYVFDRSFLYHLPWEHKMNILTRLANPSPNGVLNLIQFIIIIWSLFTIKILAGSLVVYVYFFKTFHVQAHMPLSLILIYIVDNIQYLLFYKIDFIKIQGLRMLITKLWVKWQFLIIGGHEH